MSDRVNDVELYLVQGSARWESGFVVQRIFTDRAAAVRCFEDLVRDHDGCIDRVELKGPFAHGDVINSWEAPEQRRIEVRDFE